jgi:hypothetical protein
MPLFHGHNRFPVGFSESVMAQKVPEDRERSVAVADEEEEDQSDDFLEDESEDEESESDNVGDVSVEINVESLIAEIELEHDDEAARRREVRRRLEEIREQREVLKDIEDTFTMYLDDGDDDSDDD